MVVTTYCSWTDYLTYSLLDVGPNGEGEIIEPMPKNLLDAGKWLKYSGDCIYDTVCLSGIL